MGWNPQTAHRPSPFELAVGFVGQLVMAFGLSALLSTIGARGQLGDIGIAALVWLGFVLPTLATNVVFQRLSRQLSWQDGLHWLLVLATQAAVISLFSQPG